MATKKAPKTKEQAEKKEKAPSLYERLSKYNTTIGSANEELEDIHRFIAGKKATETDMAQQIGALVVAEEELRIAADRIYNIRALLINRVRGVVVPPSKK